MSAAACMVCGSVDLVMDNGLFICQDCGCKYTVEQVRDMVAVQMGAQEGTTSSAVDYETLAQKALDEGDTATAIEILERATEEDPNDFKSPWMATIAKAYMGDISVYSLVYQMSEPLSRLKKVAEGYNEDYFNMAAVLLSSLFEYLEHYTTTYDEEMDRVEYEIAVFDGYRKLQALEKKTSLLTRKMSAIETALKIQCEALDKVLEGIVDPDCVPESYRSECRKVFKDAREINHFNMNEVTPNYKSLESLRKRYPNGGDQFWSEHPCERLELFEKISELELRQSKLEKHAKEVDEENKRIKESPKPEAPSQQNVVQLETELSQLEAKRSGLSLFRRKEKEAVSAQIAQKKKEIEAAKLVVKDELRDIEAQHAKDVQEALQKNNRGMDDEMAQLQQIKQEIADLAEKLSTHSV